MTLEEAELLLSEINSAISNVMSGKFRTDFKIGSGSSQRTYTFAKADAATILAELRDYQKEIRSVIANLSPKTIQWNRNSIIPNIIVKCE